MRARRRSDSVMAAISAPFCVAFFLVPSARAAAQDGADYDARSEAWNGLSTVVGAAQEEGMPVVVSDRVDLGTLTPRDALLLVYPTRALPVEGLSAFLRAGGRVAIADDYGQGAELLRAYHIDRRDPSATGLLRLRGNPSLLVARPTNAHPLAEGVTALVTNHPQSVHHTDLAPIFSLGDDGALVLAGAVGDGRLVAIGDPSVLINNMMQFRGNQRFAANLVRYLAEGRGGRLLLVRGDAAVVGRYGEPGADRPLHDLRAALERLAQIELPPTAVQLFAVVIAGILLTIASTALPRRSPYDGTGMFARAGHAGGFVGRVGFFSQPGRNLLAPMLVLKFELEGEIVRRMNATGRTRLGSVLDHLRSRGMPEPELAEAKALLVELDALRAKQDRPPAPPHVSESKLRAALQTSERILRWLDREPVRVQDSSSVRPRAA